MIIKNLKARKILNSGGNWTIECQLTSEKKIVTASVPSGISTGKEEKPGVPIDQAISQIEQDILSEVKSQDLNQHQLDKIIDQLNCGSNTSLAVSAAFFKLENSQELPPKHLRGVKNPKLMMLMFEGKKHGNKNLTVQEFMIIVNQVNQGVEVYQRIKKHLDKKNLLTTTGAEGGFSPPNYDENDILDLIAKYSNHKIALDVAANTNPPAYSTLFDIVRRYPVVGLEDPFPDSQTQEWQNFFVDCLKEKPDFLIIGDDLTVTDPEKIKSAAKNKLINGVIIKPNQQGSISAAVKAMDTAQKLGLKTIVSHRGEETNDTWIVDLALKYEADFVKFGAPCHGERVAKYNHLLRNF